ncbi:MAG TPA: hypothetical protein VN753_07240 [Terracidiphilus sp.]|nr:hypothetical protein [Terracidiphilus sp.]
MSSSGSALGTPKPSQNELLEAVSGLQGDRDRTAADKTRRVVMASAGVMQDQRAGRKKIRAWAIAATLVVFFIVAPPIWWLAETVVEEQHLTTFGEIAIWGFFSISALLGSALLAGWLRRRS